MTLRVLGVCGSPVQDGNTQVLLERALKKAESLGGVRTDCITLAGKKVEGCKHCNWCLTKQTPERFCFCEDDMSSLYGSLAGADAIIFATPVYIGRLSGYLATFMDRLRALIYGNVHKGTLTNKVAGAIAVGWYRHAGLETALQSIVSGILTLGMIPVSTPHCPWGAPAVSSKGGTGSFDKTKRHGALEDQWGIQAVEALAERAVCLARRISGKGVESPSGRE